MGVLVQWVRQPHALLGERPGDIVLRWVAQLHFGRSEETPALMAAWAVIGLVPALMFVTGLAMWWPRVVRKTLRG